MSWLEQLERELDQRLSGFLRNNPLQDQLFQEQHSRDRAQSLQRQRQQLQQEAKLQRQQLLQLAEDVRAWRQRSQKAREANASDLANRADQHLNGLMEQGRQLWKDLDDLGRRFNEVEQQLLELKTQQKTPSGSDLEKDWALFEAEQELKEIRKKRWTVTGFRLSGPVAPG
jgi:hercynine metabolism protein